MNSSQAAIAAVLLFACVPVHADDQAFREEVTAAMKRAADFYRHEVASHGGYVYFYSLDLEQRWGEGVATKDQIWVQPPGTPTVGLAFVEAYKATGDADYLDAATAAAETLVYGHLKSGGWTNCIDFDPQGERSADYLNGKGRGKNYSSLDDGQTQSALRLLIAVDEAHEFKHAAIHQSATIALDALLAAQFPNGAFPQVWEGPVEPQPILPASYPDYDWRTEGRIKEYWNMYTLNDNVCGYVAQALVDAHRVYGDERYLDALRKLGDFLVLAQMPNPQPGWAQQYNYQMQPIWARKFEPAAIASDESQETIATLCLIAEMTGDQKYLQPIPKALAYLEQSLLPDGRLARYYELQTNRPLYMTRRGRAYELTYSDTNLPDHYGWKVESQLAELKQRYNSVRRGDKAKPELVARETVQQIIDDLDDKGRWVSTYDGQPLVGQAKMTRGDKYLSSEQFSRNLTAMSKLLQRPVIRPPRRR
ncbi:pectate lyase [Aeoliella sp.]|uniref:pectate lyase n=1 Tax=Aeoliella sp. TaxID=2795800 RepID=UPI003CCBA9B0